jgi:4-amino-4-deoxy-L-arabinose transferase-like glycosyltransferase
MLLALMMVVGSLLLAIAFFVRFGMPPCRSGEWYETTKFILIASLMAGVLFQFSAHVWQRPLLILTGALLALVALAVNIHAGMKHDEETENAPVGHSPKRLKTAA